METKHSLIPFETDKTQWDSSPYNVIDADGEQIAATIFRDTPGGDGVATAKANAEFIVRACNAYDRDQRAIRAAYKMLLDDCADAILDTCQCDEDESEFFAIREMLKAALDNTKHAVQP